MANSHFEKWIYKTIFGCILVAAGLFFMYYSLIYYTRENWILHGLIAAIAVTSGAFLLSSGAVNKVKSDLIKKQKAREQIS